MLRAFLFALLAGLAASCGCSLCQSCDDYNGAYYGGRAGDWSGSYGRAGSVYGGAMHEEGEPYEAAQDAGDVAAE